MIFITSKITNWKILNFRKESVMLYLIQGVFFQNYQRLGLGMGGEGEGVVAMISNRLCHFMYYGVIYSDKNNVLGRLAGQMNDYFGGSSLTKVYFSPKGLEFVKKYDNKDYLIEYKFRSKDNIWVGEYSSTAIGRGKTRCIITEVPEDFFQPLNSNLL